MSYRNLLKQEIPISISFLDFLNLDLVPGQKSPETRDSYPGQKKIEKKSINQTTTTDVIKLIRYVYTYVYIKKKTF